MRIICRVFIVLYAIFIAILSMVAVTSIILLSSNNISADLIIGEFKYLFGYTYSVPITMGISIIIFLISVWLIFYSEKKREPRSPVIIEAEAGQISITLDTFESIIISALRQISEAKEYTVKVKNYKSNVSAVIKMSVVPDVNIPELAKNIQAKTAEVIEASTNVKIQNVKIKIDNIYSAPKSKAEEKSRVN